MRSCVLDSKLARASEWKQEVTFKKKYKRDTRCHRQSTKHTKQGMPEWKLVSNHTDTISAEVQMATCTDLTEMGHMEEVLGVCAVCEKTTIVRMEPGNEHELAPHTIVLPCLFPNWYQMALNTSPLRNCSVAARGTNAFFAMLDVGQRRGTEAPLVLARCCRHM